MDADKALFRGAKPDQFGNQLEWQEIGSSLTVIAFEAERLERGNPHMPTISGAANLIATLARSISTDIRRSNLGEKANFRRQVDETMRICQRVLASLGVTLNWHFPPEVEITGDAAGAVRGVILAVSAAAVQYPSATGITLDAVTAGSLTQISITCSGTLNEEIADALDRAVERHGNDCNHLTLKVVRQDLL